MDPSLGGALLALLLALYLWHRFQNHAWPFWFVLALLSVQQLALLFWRGDPAPEWLNWRADGWLLVLTLLITLPYLLKKRPE